MLPVVVKLGLGLDKYHYCIMYAVCLCMTVEKVNVLSLLQGRTGLYS